VLDEESSDLEVFWNASMKSPRLSPRLLPTARLRPRDRILKQEAAGTVVLLDLDGGQYFALDDAGSRIWDLCDGRQTAAGIVEIISGEYNAPAETIKQDVMELLQELADEKLLDQDNSEAAAV
jgi:hypothetical protein